MKTETTARRPPRATVWSCIIYPDSCPDWMKILTESSITAAASPLHDRDIKDCYSELDEEEQSFISDEELYKKAHYHILLHFPSAISQNGIIHRLTNFAANNVFEMVSSEPSYYKYLTHELNPEKAQYSADDVILFNGYVPPMDDVKITPYEIYLMCAEACAANPTLNTVTLIEYVRSNKDEAYSAAFVKFFFSHAYAVKTILADFA